MGTEIPVGATRERVTLRHALKTIVTLFKLRIVSLLLFSALAGAFLGARGVPSWLQLLTILLTGTLAAGGASAINQFLERDSDGLARRTSRRPLVTGEVERPWMVLGISIAIIAIA